MRRPLEETDIMSCYTCDVCDCRAVYDLDWYKRVDPNDKFHRWRGDMRIICEKCVRAGYRVIVTHEVDSAKDHTEGEKDYGRYQQTPELS